MDIKYKILYISLALILVFLLFQIFSEKTLVITVDSEGDSNQIRSILDILKDENVRATFFVVGKTCEEYPDLCREIAENHEIACHTYSHANFELLSEEEWKADILKGKEVVKSITGKDCIGFRSPNYLNSKEIYEFTNKEFLYTSNWVNSDYPNNIKPTYGDYISYKRTHIGLDMFKAVLNIKRKTILAIHPQYTGANPKRLEILKGFIQYAKARNVKIIAMEELAKR